MHTPYEEFTLE